MVHIDYKGYSFWSDIGMMTPEQYTQMIDLLELYKPERICELGSGQSTEIFETYSKNYQSIVYSIEHDIFYRTHKCNVLLPLLSKVDYKIGNKIYKNCEIYDGLESWLDKQDKFDFILIDGPNDTLPMNEDNLKYSRIQLLSFLLNNKINDNSVIMYHDSNTEEAKNTLNEFERLLKEKNVLYEKETVVENNKEITEHNISVLGICPELAIYKIKKINSNIN